MSDTAPADHAYNAVDAQIDLPSMEHDILALWKDQGTFEASLERTAEGEPWTFFEGPPTANGMPGTHHIEARVFKDVFPRFKTMQGYRVDRKAGWDCHGLPVELAVEKELGFNGKPDIEKYGVEPFNAQCRASVSRHVDAFTELTERMGYWVNLDDAYWTMSPEYIDSEWWALKKIFDDGLLSEDYRVAPYCPRCGTTLSDHELAQGYEDVVDPSVYVRFPLTSGPLAGDVDLLVWTTTPWTLVSNTAVAAHPEVTYVVASKDGRSLLVAEPLVEKALGEGWALGQRFAGRELEYWRYQRPFDLVTFPEVDGGTNYVIMADYVTTDDGTGLVHEAPAFGEDDMITCRGYGLPLVNPVRPDGTFEAELPLVGGLFFKSADRPLIEDLVARDLLFRELPYDHSYPHCWRCDTPLLYYAQPSWYIRTTQRKAELIAQNEATTWHPEHIKHGRYGDWLNNNIDWALSRTRYWGTPLPIWRNDADPSLVRAIGSRAELAELAGRPEVATMDPHRPFIDDVTFTVDGVEGTFRRVPEVIDAWFDSGSMPFAQWGYPYVEGSVEKFESHFPADFICEAIDQTRGWFYSLMAASTMVFGESSYKNVLCLGHILAEDGRKMSKHLGNILEPIPLMDRHGADAVRWFMAAGGSPWASRRVGHGTITETVRKVLLTYWNAVAFQSLYARTNGWSPTGTAPALDDRPVMDRWLVSVRNQLIADTTEALEAFDTQRYGTLISEFVDHLSNWYVRRSRRRFWTGEASALWTLHETLDVVTRLMAPLAPFITERVWQDLIVASTPDAPVSVHLATWPTPDAAIDERLNASMDLARRLVELGRGARAEAKVKTRQPLAQILVPSSSYAKLDAELLAEVASELNVGAVNSFASAGDIVDYSAKGNFRALGKRFGKETPQVAAAIAAADGAELAASLAASGEARVDYAGGTVVTADEVIMSERPREGWSVVNEQGETVALDLEITPELARAGLAREVVRFIQETRKASGLDVSDRIAVAWSASDASVRDAIVQHEQLIADEVLATSFEAVHELGPDARRDPALSLGIELRKV